jgi:hypothetical protein
MDPNQAKDENNQTVPHDSSNDQDTRDLVTPEQVATPPGSGQHTKTSEPSERKKARLKIPSNLLVLIILVVVVGLFLTFYNNKSSSNSKVVQLSSVKVPSSWKTINTGLGYTVKAPSNWSLGSSSKLTTDGLIDNSASIGATGNSQAQLNDTVTASTQKITGTSSEAAFDKKVTSLSSQEMQLLKAFGINTNKVQITSSNVEINGREWFKVTTYIPYQYSYNLYLWDNNHAVAIVVSNHSQQTVQQLAKNYVLPMAASLKIKS